MYQQSGTLLLCSVWWEHSSAIEDTYSSYQTAQPVSTVFHPQVHHLLHIIISQQRLLMSTQRMQYAQVCYLLYMCIRVSFYLFYWFDYIILSLSFIIILLFNLKHLQTTQQQVAVGHMESLHQVNCSSLL